MRNNKPQPSQQRIIYGIACTFFAAITGLVILAYTQSNKDARAPLKSLASSQQADAPLGYQLASTQASTPFDHRFIQLSAFERAVIPTATRMTYAMGTRYGGLSYNAQHFWDQNPMRGGYHTGDDINGIGGMNTDLGDSVYAIADGIAYYRGEPSPSWGKTIILAHRNQQGEILLSMYSHLNNSYAAYGQLVHQSEEIGTVGTANNNYPAHLHLEMRDSTGIHMGRGYISKQGEFLNPSQIIQDAMAKATDNLHPSILSIALREKWEQHKNQFFKL
ncbi:MAG: M23 family metallopeptidase [Akkermansiaceae bacterium]|nr:M23 family metallopeptidase [Akkermansiaceae bacterium]